MKFSLNYTFIILLNFIFTLILFYIFYQNSVQKFIGRLNKNVYISSTIICVIGFFITFYYISIKNDFTKKETHEIFSAILFIIKFTSLWIICSTYENIYVDVIIIILIHHYSSNIYYNVIYVYIFLFFTESNTSLFCNVCNC